MRRASEVQGQCAQPLLGCQGQRATRPVRRYGKASAHGLRFDADSTINHVGLAAVLLMQGEKAGLTEAKEHLDRADRLLANHSNKDLAEDVAVLRGVYAALSGDPAAARQMLNVVLGKKKPKDRDPIEKMLQAIGD